MYCKFNITQIIIIEDVGNIIKVALEVFRSVYKICLLNRAVSTVQNETHGGKPIHHHMDSRLPAKQVTTGLNQIKISDKAPCAF